MGNTCQLVDFRDVLRLRYKLDVFVFHYLVDVVLFIFVIVFSSLLFDDGVGVNIIFLVVKNVLIKILIYLLQLLLLYLLLRLFIFGLWFHILLLLR